MGTKGAQWNTGDVFWVCIIPLSINIADDHGNISFWMMVMIIKSLLRFGWIIPNDTSVKEGLNSYTFAFIAAKFKFRGAHQ
jgi:hypothetical protein